MLKVECKENSTIVKGNIKSLEDFDEIRKCLDSIKEMYKEIEIKLIDSHSITSSLLGYLYKLQEKEDIAVKIFVRNEELFELLDDLNINFEIKRLDE